ncbi:murein hydrolase activator EnvC family protein [Desulfofustis limnaeus]|jgi:septal ring factor EnvC (AmiA/AmiB activator)|uniref:Peptidase M23 n=1 Tax=Desulfofustis limnaeus TaxID=2740163 RepID=A0ABM7W7L1_9BACT|nr:peptidoglycan DD-metalloendopeptidase family protein [Desulfofustis limnaeus]MDX9894685.1 peptidoglycan DD-metalloendopeptidase family protein [Desulfofustis sp.]BDD86949.1 peptidase M23 [Desulfofustis limnaeus]
MGRLFSAQTARATLAAILFCVACPLFTTPGDLAWGETPEERQRQKEEVSQGIKTYRINIRRLQEGIQKQQEQITQTRQQERNLLAELQNIDIRLNEQLQKLDVLEARMQAQQELITVKDRELERARGEKQAVQEHLMKRIQAYYKMGNIGFINVTFSTQTLPELLRFHDSFQTLIRYDRDVIATYRHTIGEMEQAIDTMELEKALLQEFIAQNETERRKLGELRQEKEVLLTRIRTQQKLHQQAIEEMEQARSSLTSSLQVLERKEDLLDQSFARSKGKIPPPVQGGIITRFGEQTTNRLGITSVSNGLAIEAPTGTMVRAVHEGTVEFSGYLRGYGNTVIVNHGQQYYSITSRVDRILVEKGKKVDERTDIAVMGDTATLFNEGLYFEIRHGATLLDPLDWLDAGQLTAIQ